jgi:UDP-N-acetylmuramoyl-L-alanyl-D-glutamate--2,6-diaminopimelate ligase
MSVTLGQIAERLRRVGLFGDTPPDGEWQALPVTGVAVDSRRVGPGTLFAAVPGTHLDGHRFLAEVASRGAAAALVECLEPALPLPQLAVGSTREAAAHAAAEFYADPWNDLLLVGITGTNGKTTTAAILRHLLSRRMPAASVGTLGMIGSDGEVVAGSEGLTTPGPVEVAEWLRRLHKGGVSGVAMEVSSHALDQGRVAAARFDAAIFTNLSRDHLDYHGTFEAYRDAKLRLLELLKPGCVAVVNIDDAVWKGVAENARRCLSYGTGIDARVKAQNVTIVQGGMEWTLRTPDAEAPVRLPLFGSYNVSNALGAAAALWSLGWPVDEIAEGLETLPQVPGRLECVVGGPGIPTVLVDYAHTPDALARALTAVRPLVRGRLIAVFGAGGDRDRGKRPEMGRVAAASADLVIVTSDNPRTEDPERIIDDIESGMGDAPRLRVPDRAEAIERALAEAGGDDLILLAGKGHETYQICGTDKRPFDERQVVRAILEQGARH